LANFPLLRVLYPALRAAVTCDAFLQLLWVSLLAVVCLTRQGALQCAWITSLPQLFITVSQGLSCYSGIPGPRTQDYTKQVEPRPTQNPNLVYKAKSYPNTTTTDPENVQPLNGKQQGVLDVEGAASPVRPLSCTS
jgi:hypothetical protein